MAVSMLSMAAITGCGNKNTAAPNPATPTPIATLAPTNTPTPDTDKVVLKDGTYEKIGTEAEQGYIYEMKMVVENGVITSLTYDGKNEAGESKATLSLNGGYTMTETGLTWAAQAEALANYVIENSSVTELKDSLDADGKTDVITGVSINIQGFLAYAEELLTQASK